MKTSRGNKVQTGKERKATKAKVVCLLTQVTTKPTLHVNVIAMIAKEVDLL
jgi:hypothetical protein